jgi:hypothetical protein
MMAPLAQGNREVCAEFMRFRPLFDRGKEVFDKLSTLRWRKVWGYWFERGCWLSAGYRLRATGYGLRATGSCCDVVYKTGGP